MAVQFPNFLAAQLVNPDYSGIGSAVSNFYEGYDKPNDALIKKIQAEFARPLAEQSLLSSKLSNRKSQMDISKLAMEMEQQRELENQMKKALGAGAAGAMPSGMSSNMPAGMPAGGSPMPSGQQPAIPAGLAQQLAASAASGASSPSMQPQMASGLNYTPIGAGSVMPMPSPTPTAATSPAAAAMPAAQAQQPMEQPQMNEVVISKGSPQLAGIDAMYDSNPLSRAFLEKKGYKKAQQIKFDNKTGKTSVITTYPSGKVTVQTMGSTSGGEGIPLTNKMISKHQNIISSIDNALPVIKEIEELDKGEWEPYPRSTGYRPGLGWVPGWQSQSNKYEALVSSALDSLVGAYGLPSTNEGIETVRKQLLIGHGETDRAYKRRLKNLVEDLIRRKNYSASEVKRSNKIQPISYSDSSGGDNEGMYSSNEWEVV